MFFGEYLRVLNRVRDAIEKRAPLADLTGEEERIEEMDADRLASVVSNYLHRQLQDIFEYHSRLAPASSQEALREALYLTAAVSDELLLMDADWEGRECWVNYLLEVKLFGTSSAGETIFSKIQNLL